MAPINASTHFSEDCLSLNVWTPAADDGKRATLVWIHGGGLVWGGSSPAVYDGSAFARDDVAFVSINYRLGPFGFLYLDELFDDIDGSGNAGLLDQICALEWVRDNIDQFGGDADNVTIFGQSAGGFSVADLMGTPSASGLFRRAIVQSGGAWIHTRQGATAVTQAALKLMGVSAGDLAGLQEVPPQQLVGVTETLRSEGEMILGNESRNMHPLLFLPVVDGVVLPEHPGNAISSGSARDVDLMIGWCANEANVYRSSAKSNEALEARLLKSLQTFLNKNGTSVEALLAEYRRIDPAASTVDLLLSAHSDAMYRIPSLKLAESQARQHDSVWVFEFAWPSPVGDGTYGSFHTLEIPFVFDQLVAPGIHGDAPPKAVATSMHDAWVHFAKTGTPTHRATSGWPRFDGSGGRMVVLDEAISTRDAIHPSLRHVWAPLLVPVSAGAE